MGEGLRLPLRGGPVWDESAVQAACEELAVFIEAEARRVARQLGFGWVGRSDAPDRFDALQAAFAAARQSGAPLPVSDAANQHSLFPRPATNLALRFWHDVEHVRRGRSFRAADELEVAMYQVGVAEAAGLSSLAVRLLEADLAGQTLLYAVTRGYAADQARFDRNVLRYGIAEAICIETVPDDA